MDIRTVGFIGIGNMGRPMAANLLKGGYHVVAYDADPKRAQQLAQEAGVPTNPSARTMIPTSRSILRFI